MSLTPVMAVAVAAAAASLLFAALWLVQRRTGDAGIVDVGWSLSLGAMAAFYALVLDADPARRALVAALAGAASVRLALHLVVRGRGRPEDGRYRTLREQWGASAQRRLFAFFQFQAVAAALLSIPALSAMMAARTSSSVWTVAGALIALAAIAGEAAADRQLQRFRADPANRGRTCRAGWWRLSRHPNYFFQWLLWIAWAVMSAGSPWFWGAAWAVPVMLFVLTRLTGIPATEAQAMSTRPDYAAYRRTTSAFIPWAPRVERTAAGPGRASQGDEDT